MSLRFAPLLRQTARSARFAAPAMAVAAPRFVVPALTRAYAAAPGLSAQEIQNRISEVLKSFEKVDVAKVSPEASFTGDLGLDSLDAVEVVMAIEEEFSIEIPDDEADNITSVQQAIDYVAKSPAAH